MQSATEPAVVPTLFSEGYGLYGTQKSSFVFSFLVHGLGLALLFMFSRYLVEHRREIRQQLRRCGRITKIEIQGRKSRHVF